VLRKQCARGVLRKWTSGSQRYPSPHSNREYLRQISSGISSAFSSVIHCSTSVLLITEESVFSSGQTLHIRLKRRENAPRRTLMFLSATESLEKICLCV
jgi:hypothetical protein